MIEQRRALRHARRLSFQALLRFHSSVGSRTYAGTTPGCASLPELLRYEEPRVHGRPDAEGRPSPVGPRGVRATPDAANRTSLFLSTVVFLEGAHMGPPIRDGFIEEVLVWAGGHLSPVGGFQNVCHKVRQPPIWGSSHPPVLISCCDMYCRLQDTGGSFRCVNSVLGARKSLAALGLRLSSRYGMTVADGGVRKPHLTLRRKGMNRKGFTLIELLIVVVNIGSLAAI